MYVALGNGVMWETNEAWNWSWAQFVFSKTCLAEGAFDPSPHDWAIRRGPAIRLCAAYSLSVGRASLESQNSSYQLVFLCQFVRPKGNVLYLEAAAPRTPSMQKPPPRIPETSRWPHVPAEVFHLLMRKDKRHFCSLPFLNFISCL